MPEARPQRDEAARARNARNQQLHRQRQRVSHITHPIKLCFSRGRGAAAGIKPNSMLMTR